jgi:hypothetical protein
MGAGADVSLGLGLARSKGAGEATPGVAVAGGGGAKLLVCRGSQPPVNAQRLLPPSTRFSTAQTVPIARMKTVAAEPAITFQLLGRWRCHQAGSAPEGRPAPGLSLTSMPCSAEVGSWGRSRWRLACVRRMESV